MKYRKKPIVNDIKTAVKYFELLGCSVLKPKHKNANGPDLNIIKNNEAFRVEIKQVKKKKSNSWQVEPIMVSRQSDDFVLIMHKLQIIELISMKNHLELCVDCGSRVLTSKMRILI
jgi:hypothetical protein